ncbi:WhiB family transcriptional regulator [Mycobacterium sp. E796]|uniref:WhiB family transcriptional regulator n=1 Tax=Mycobacterium sp. E796 TaxID=1834151 RepID=UPI0008011242|nr:WhiB family transcriptional regulator [Mycobacterium sp. E796]OBI52955.1 hypothetical protein A5706_22925 [Mycobacterium sp. E796]
MGWSDLAAILARAPAFPGARCAGRSALFDPHSAREPDREEREAEALSLCRDCPALTACREWFATLAPAEKPWGVIAGELRREPLPPTGRRYVPTGRPTGRPRSKA